MRVAESVYGLLQEAAELYRDNPRASAWLAGHLERYAEPLRLAVLGAQQTGKSTLVSALVGEQVSPLADAPLWIIGGPTAEVTGYPLDGPPVRVPVSRSEDGPVFETDDWPGDPLGKVELRWPSRALRELTLIDTTARDEVGMVAGAADAMLYLVRHPHAGELEPLRAAVRGVDAVRSMVVVAQADQLGGSRIDALTSAKQIARRARESADGYQTVVSVAGLLGLAARTLTEPEFALLRDFSVVARADLAPWLLSADRFTSADFPWPVGVRQRTALLDRFGIFGVRLCVTLLRTGVSSPRALADELARRSGLLELRESITTLFTDRSDVLKARSAMIGLEPLLRKEKAPGSAHLLARFEEITAGAHEFRELRLLGALHAGRLALPEELEDEAARLIGAAGTDPAARLGRDEDVSAAELEDAATRALHRWQTFAEDPQLGPAEQQAARVVVRSCEALLADHPE